MGRTKKEVKLEDKFQMLDEIIEKLEDKDISLEDSFKVYQQGMELLMLRNN